jgi:hypothetical protein
VTFMTSGKDCLKRSNSSSGGFCDDCLLRNMLMEKRGRSS